MSTSGRMKTSAFRPSALRKVGHDARAFREASRRLGGGKSLVAGRGYAQRSSSVRRTPSLPVLGDLIVATVRLDAHQPIAYS